MKDIIESILQDFGTRILPPDIFLPLKAENHYNIQVEGKFRNFKVESSETRE